MTNEPLRVLLYMGAWLLIFLPVFVISQATCPSGYATACQFNGDCITGCGSSLKRERSDQFCSPESDPNTPICDNTTYKCCKVRTGAIVGICVGGGILIIMIAYVFAIFVCPKKGKKSEPANEVQQEDAGAK